MRHFTLQSHINDFFPYFLRRIFVRPERKGNTVTCTENTIKLENEEVVGSTNQSKTDKIS